MRLASIACTFSEDLGCGTPLACAETCAELFAPTEDDAPGDAAILGVKVRLTDPLSSGGYVQVRRLAWLIDVRLGGQLENHTGVIAKPRGRA